MRPPDSPKSASVLLWLGWSCAGSQDWGCVWNQRAGDQQEQGCSAGTGDPGARQGKQRRGQWGLSNLAMARWQARSQVSQGEPSSNSWVAESGTGFCTASLGQGKMAPGSAELGYWAVGRGGSGIGEDVQWCFLVPSGQKAWFRTSAEYRLQKQIKIVINVKHKKKRRRVAETKHKQVGICAHVDVYIKRMEKWLPCPTMPFSAHLRSRRIFAL